MYYLLLLALLQSVLLAGCQVFLKFAVSEMGSFEWNKAFWLNILTNWWLLGSGLCFAFSSLLWIFILKHYPFSMAYPLISISYVFGLIASMVFFHETIPLTRWLGVFLIIGGCFLIVKE